MKKYTYKPIKVMAVQWDGSNEAFEKICTLTDNDVIVMNPNIHTGNKVLLIQKPSCFPMDQGDWIVEDKGKLITCDNEYFKMHYEEIE